METLVEIAGTFFMLQAYMQGNSFIKLGKFSKLPVVNHTAFSFSAIKFENIVLTFFLNYSSIVVDTSEIEC